MKLIDKDALVAEIEKRLEELYNHLPDASKVENGMITISEACDTGKYTALESFENYIDTLEVKEVDLEKIKRDWRNKGYIEGRKQALIPARKLGLPKSLNIIDMEEVKAAAKAWSEDDENTRGCDYIGATVAERAFVACAEWLINKAQKGE